MQNKQTKGSMGRFFSMLWKARLPYVWIVGYLVANVLLTNVGVSATEYTAQLYAGNVDFWGVVIPFLVVSLVSLVIGSVSGILSGICMARIDRNLRRAVWQKIVRLPFGYYQQNAPKELISRVTTDISTISALIMQVFLLALTSLYSTVRLFVQIRSYNSRLMVATLVLLPLQVVIGVLAGQLKFGLSDQVNRRTAELTEAVSERTGQAMLIKSFSAQQREDQAVGSRARAYYKTSIQNAWVTNFVSPVYVLVGALQFIVIVMVGRGFYADGSITLAQWVAYFAFANQIINNLTAYTGYWTSLKSAQGATNRVSAVMAEPEEDRDAGDPVDALQGDIVFDHLRFGYGAAPLFDDLCLTIPQGRATAVIGPSGSGKTTLLNLVERLYTPQDGTIRIGSDDIRRFAKRSYRAALTYITQESTMLSGTIRENLVFGVRREVEDTELDRICEEVGLLDYIRSLPAGYDTQVGEDGSRLSGGQKQKLAAARGMLKNSAYFLMDEGTAAMDAQSKDAVWNAVSRLMHGKTTLYVAHDRQTVLKADYVVVMDRGRVAAFGPIEEVYETNQYLRQLVGEGGLNR
ncbi:MAG: ABC transporter ATP-binding protein [Gemmiger sp.]|uniref:ABC transporter ATP-binding protein n=1 Tax=Gemmiger sp. TaxID=2049027 RepID=UPI002E76378B|nr:ABC transporter ATP-binding protein [Gemmiger sp.]MEE0800622.1 ABC transporter ATP-binding protein [Gemmiger sp.]